MTINQGVASGCAGFVRAVFVGRCRGFAVPADLLRQQARAANLLSAMRHNEAVRARLAEDFGGYLVTDGAPGVWRDGSGRVMVIGRGRTGMRMVGDDDLLLPDFAGELAALDAPSLVPAGAMCRSSAGFSAELGVCAVLVGCWRGGVFE